jgi:hypothetical protein
MFNTQKIKVSDVIEVEGALRALLRAKYPEISVEEGSALNDLVIKSMGYLATAIKTEVDEVKGRLYLADLEDSTLSDSQVLLENLASNFLVSVDDAPPRRGIVDFVFSSNSTRSIPAGIILTRGNSVIYVKLYDSSEDLVITPEEYIESTDSGTTVYTYPVLMETTSTAEEVTVVPGAFKSTTNLVGLVEITNKNTFLGISSTEYTRSDLVSRMRYAQTLRGFSSRNSIQATLLNEGIAHLNKVVGVGAGDPEMARDIIPNTLSSTRFHSLGMVNVFVSSRLELSNSTLTAGVLESPAKPILGFSAITRGGVSLPLVSDFGTVRYTKSYDLATGVTTFTSADIVSGEDLPDGSASVYVTSEEERLLPGSSTQGRFKIEKKQTEGDPTGIQVWVDNNIPIVQGLIDSDNYNTLGSDVKCLATPLVQVIVPSLVVKVVSGISSTTVRTYGIKRLVIDLINTWTENYAIPTSEILSRIMLAYGGTLASVTFPLGVQYLLYLPDGRVLGYSSTDSLTVENTGYQISPNSLSALDIQNLQVSDRLLNYQANTADITVEVLDV